MGPTSSVGAHACVLINTLKIVNGDLNQLVASLASYKTNSLSMAQLILITSLYL